LRRFGRILAALQPFLLRPAAFFNIFFAPLLDIGKAHFYLWAKSACALRAKANRQG